MANMITPDLGDGREEVGQMEWAYEKAKRQESARGGAWPARWPSPQRGQTARQSGKRSQGWPGQKSQEENRRPAQCAASSTGPQKEIIEKVIAAICVRFGEKAIGLGEHGFRGESLPHARTA